MILVPFEVEHARGMLVQRAQACEVTDDALRREFGTGWTAMQGDQPIACAGLVEVWPGRAYAWALLSIFAGRYMVGITRGIRCHLEAAPYRRIEMAVDAQFEAGRRWAEMLGFRLETPQPMAGFFPNGNPAWLYARVKDELLCNGRDRTQRRRLDHAGRGRGAPSEPAGGRSVPERDDCTTTG